MIAALLARPKVIEFRGERITLRRPNVADMAALLDARERGENLVAWLIHNHVMDGDSPAFESLEQCLRLEAVASRQLAEEIDKLYSEGMD
jgi:hypothetical protein